METRRKQRPSLALDKRTEDSEDKLDSRILRFVAMPTVFIRNPLFRGSGNAPYILAVEVLSVIYQLSKRTGYFNKSNRYLATIFGCSTVSISKAIAHLRKIEGIRIENPKGKSRRIFIRPLFNLNLKVALELKKLSDADFEMIRDRIHRSTMTLTLYPPSVQMALSSLITTLKAALTYKEEEQNKNKNTEKADTLPFSFAGTPLPTCGRKNSFPLYADRDEENNLTEEDDFYPEFTQEFKEHITKILHHSEDVDYLDETEVSQAIMASRKLNELISEWDYLNDPDGAKVHNATPFEYVLHWCEFIKERFRKFIQRGTLTAGHFIYKDRYKDEFRAYLRGDRKLWLKEHYGEGTPYTDRYGPD